MALSRAGWRARRSTVIGGRYHRGMASLPFRAALPLLLLGLAACATPLPDTGTPHPAPQAAVAVSGDPPAAVASRDSVLLVSLDGFHPRYLTLGITPALSRLADAGTRAEWMSPSYPTLTFPNHYTLVTGLRPDHQGIVHNTMQDAALGGFRMSDRMAVGDSRWWGGEPIWIGAEKAGLPSATLFWPGSEAEIDGLRPTRWQSFDASVAPEARADTVRGWMAEPDATRPRIATLYLEHVDTAAHAHGPDSAEALAAVRLVDAAIGRLVDGMAADGTLARTNIVVVSDHGMAEVPAGQAIDVATIVDPALATVVTTGQVLTVQPLPGQEDAAARALVGAHARHDCWRKADLPPRWHYGSHPRIPAIVCQMHEGWDAVTAGTLAKRPTDHPRGSHGYDPELASMRALFIAHGPAFRSGAVIAPFDNVHVYPLLARLVGIPAAPGDGEIAALLPALRELPTRASPGSAAGAR